ncbi:nuclear transcription factor Y subunit B-4-like [Brachypodium distachyon]|uniref:Transcription factor CBF/NF-Y/archaeal histone domain-containing protein n=1 Tax=Brachypodium distachyon TaxID=15368 RepID=I1HUZ2_BRADI|nr:nuclear transcription factor Y subunit B-4-like [Brachypodium distachyon]PNT73540.1 hypothetical protein BRADI_2g60030v3 [Brachypodium distachyon]|eukprot:XP_024315117.1 nuclear transcription factor Y subunit B-4-like [Brachypodium distachyon]
MSDTFNLSGFTLPGPTPRISHASTSAVGAGAGPGEEEEHQGGGGLLPIANVGRIMKGALPPEAKVSKRAKEAIQECATEFVAFVTGEASQRCRRERRKTVNGDDVCHAMRSLGLDHYAAAMGRYLQRHREAEELAAEINGRSVGGGGVPDFGGQIDVRAQLSVSGSRAGAGGSEKRLGRN